MSKKRKQLASSSEEVEQWRKFRDAMQIALAEVLATNVLAIPNVFLATHPKALKLGIDRDLLERFPGADPMKLNRWLRLWTSSRLYVKRLMRGKHRHDLDDNDVEEITEFQRGHAYGRLGWPVPKVIPLDIEQKQEQAA